MSRWSRYLIGFGIVLFVLENLPGNLSEPLSPILSTLAPLLSIWWVFFFAGIGLVAVRRWNIDTPIASGSALARHDIIQSTNWSRMNKYEFRRSIAVALIAAPIPVFILAAVIQRFDVALIWAVITVMGVLWILSLSRDEDITHDFTKSVEVRIPNLFSLHSFHLHLRQTVEDLGYVTAEDTSPERGGARSSHSSDVFLAEGGFTARKQAIPPSRSLLGGDSENSGPGVLSVLTLGIFLLMLGVTLVWIAPEIEGDIQQYVPVAGGIVLLAGIVVTASDYYSRTNNWREIYCVEEGTVYSPTVEVDDTDNEHADSPERGNGLSLDMDRPEALSLSMGEDRSTEIRTSQTSGVVTVTIGARRSAAVDTEQFESEFETMQRAIEDAVEEHELEMTTVLKEA